MLPWSNVGFFGDLVGLELAGVFLAGSYRWEGSLKRLILDVVRVEGKEEMPMTLRIVIKLNLRFRDKPKKKVNLAR